MPKLSIFIATSLDGYIARYDGSIDWLMEANQLARPREDCGYKAFISTVDLGGIVQIKYQLNDYSNI
ncbi:dihydrofolate reductase [Legionella waltersii]|uniref:Dihydrofolate reductase n=1 Tax=Legionella waltersii TaxID=66969 RepID=A0A0W1AP20_9GAMM|nr:hypothetical protein [Legionella waltersii]KTD83045.1 dihydrofolate reductase [Legionella waltersii]SNU97490.1 dihydrofolate reductase [Legionella waltersii]